MPLDERAGDIHVLAIGRQSSVINKANTGQVLAFAFNPDDTTLAVRGFDGMTRLRNLVTRQPIGSPLPTDPRAVCQRS